MMSVHVLTAFVATVLGTYEASRNAKHASRRYGCGLVAAGLLLADVTYSRLHGGPIMITSVAAAVALLITKAGAPSFEWTTVLFLITNMMDSMAYTCDNSISSLFHVAAGSLGVFAAVIFLRRQWVFVSEWAITVALAGSYLVSRTVIDDPHGTSHLAMSAFAVVMTATNLHIRSHLQAGVFYAITGFVMASSADELPPTAQMVHRVAGFLMIAMGWARADRAFQSLAELSIVWAISIVTAGPSISDCWPFAPSLLVALVFAASWWALLTFEALTTSLRVKYITAEECTEVP